MFERGKSWEKSFSGIYNKEAPKARTLSVSHLYSKKHTQSALENWKNKCKEMRIELDEECLFIPFICG